MSGVLLSTSSVVSCFKRPAVDQYKDPNRPMQKSALAPFFGFSWKSLINLMKDVIVMLFLEFKPLTR